MKVWQKRLLGILAIGGGSIGGAQCLVALASASRVVEWLLILAALVFYSWGVFCGTRLIESHPEAARQNRLFWLIQVPTFSTPLAGYFLSCGFHLTVKLEIAPFKLGANFLLGSTFDYSLLQAQAPIFIGINLFAFGIAGWLTRIIGGDQAVAVSSSP